MVNQLGLPQTPCKSGQSFREECVCFQLQVRRRRGCPARTCLTFGQPGAGGRPCRLCLGRRDVSKPSLFTDLNIGHLKEREIGPRVNLTFSRGCADLGHPQGTRCQSTGYMIPTCCVTQKLTHTHTFSDTNTMTQMSSTHRVRWVH